MPARLFLWRRRTGSEDGRPICDEKVWILTHVTRVWTALFTLASLGAAFVYKPQFLTLYLRATMTAIETGTAALPYPWRDRLEVGLTRHWWVGLDAVCIRHRVRPPRRNGASSLMSALHRDKFSQRAQIVRHVAEFL